LPCGESLGFAEVRAELASKADVASVISASTFTVSRNEEFEVVDEGKLC
jgi:hypothetical protein